MELRERIMAARRELKLAQEDGADDWIDKASLALDELLDQLPRVKAPA